MALRKGRELGWKRMPNQTPMFEPMRKLCGRAAGGVKSALEKQRARLAEQGMAGMNALLGDWIEPELLRPQKKGAGSRRRVFDLATTFQAFLWQALHAQASCRDAVREVQGARLANNQPMPDSSTGGYCQIHRAMIERMARLARPEDRWLGREVKVIDGTGLRVEDTNANARRFGYPGGQAPGCGFPIVKLAGLFSLSSGAWLAHETAKAMTHDMAMSASLLGEQWQPGDVLLGDRGYCAYWLLALAVERGADAVLRLHQARSSDMRRGERLGEGDRLQVWSKPQRPPRCFLSEEEYASLPDQLCIRVVSMRLEKRGQRTREVMLATTLDNPTEVPRAALAELYMRRWQIELNFDDLKTTLAMEHLACKSPAMIERSVWVFSCAYNLVRALMLEAAVRSGVTTWRLSFKGSGGALANWLGGMRGRTSQRRAQALWESLLEIVAQDIVPLRPHRHEPRVVKRRPKSYQLLTRPRHQMKTSPHRN
jgi:Transposase DDE domain